MNIDLGITAEGMYDVTIDAINPDTPDTPDTVTFGSSGTYTVYHHAEPGLEPRVLTPSGPITLCPIKFTRQWTTIQDREVALTIDRERNSAKIQLRNLYGAHIPRDYRILVKIVKIGDQIEAGLSPSASGNLAAHPIAFPFTLTVSEDTKAILWSDRITRSLATCRMDFASSSPSLTFSTIHGKQKVLLHHPRRLGLVEALRTMQRHDYPRFG